MANPYRDEHGKYCSKNEMFNAVLRLQAAGETNEASALFLEFKNIEKEAEKRAATKKTAAKKTPATKKAEPAKPAATASPAKKTAAEKPASPTLPAGIPERNTYPDVSEKPAEERAEILTQFFNDYQLTAGDPELRQEAQDAYQDHFEYQGGWASTRTYEPQQNLEGKAQRLYGFADEDGESRVLFAYKGGLYVDGASLDDSWGHGAKHSYDTKPANPEPVVTEAGTKDGWKIDPAQTNFDAAEGWAVTNRQNLPNSFANREGITWVHADEEEVSHGYWTNSDTFRDETTGIHYQRTTTYSSWDDGYDDRSVHWTQVVPHTWDVPAAVRFVPAED